MAILLMIGYSTPITETYRRNNMELNKQFTITYYSNKDKKHITRKASGQTNVDIGLAKLEIV